MIPDSVWWTIGVFYFLVGLLDVAVLWANYRKEMNIWLTLIGIFIWPWVLYMMFRHPIRPEK